MTTPRLERPAFFDGQRLGPQDLDAIYAYHRDLRWLHNSSLHNWGIAAGLDAFGEKGDREVQITAGYAVDCDGHDIVLCERRALPVPADSGPATYFLTASFVADSDLVPAEAREGVCEGGGAVRRIEAPRLRWQRPLDLAPESRYRRGLDLVLATAAVEECRLAKPLSLDDRRSALGESRPFIASGASPEGDTTWSFYPNSTTRTGVQCVVDTSAAGFGATPLYLAHVIGSRTLSANRIIEGFVSIESSAPTGFTVRVALPRDISLPPFTLNPSVAIVPGFTDILKTTLKWSVSWIGIES